MFLSLRKVFSGRKVLALINFSGISDRFPCDRCVQRTTSLFEKMLTEPAQEMLKAVILSKLTCPQDILCDQEATKPFYDYMAKKDFFSEEGAEQVCVEVDSKCQRYHFLKAF